jgi:hypothetical protein
MKRLICGVALVVALAALAVTSAFAAGGKGSQTLTATCSPPIGTVTVHASSGGSAWVDNTHWVVLTLTGTFTPTGGSPTPVSKTYGNKTGFNSRTKTSCSGLISNSSGTFSFTVTVAKTTR